jgi:hypothetical protein
MWFHSKYILINQARDDEYFMVESHTDSTRGYTVAYHPNQTFSVDMFEGTEEKCIRFVFELAKSLAHYEGIRMIFLENIVNALDE